jgi:hypothetical protein
MVVTRARKACMDLYLPLIGKFEGYSNLNSPEHIVYKETIMEFKTYKRIAYASTFLAFFALAQYVLLTWPM